VPLLPEDIAAEAERHSRGTLATLLWPCNRGNREAPKELCGAEAELSHATSAATRAQDARTRFARESRSQLFHRFTSARSLCVGLLLERSLTVSFQSGSPVVDRK